MPHELKLVSPQVPIASLPNTTPPQKKKTPHSRDSALWTNRHVNTRIKTN